MVDLLFRETDEKRAANLLAEIERCSDCQYQYVTMKETLNVFDRVSDSIAPDESYWQAYHQTLRRELDAEHQERARQHLPAHQAAAQSVPFWKRIFASSIRLPVPVAAVVLMLVMGSTLLALRRGTSSPTAADRLEAVASTGPAAQIKVVEVPIFQQTEKVLTRTVYVERNSRQAKQQESGPARTADGQQPLVANSAERADRPREDATARQKRETEDSPHADLAGFKPAQDVKLTIIKGNFQNEK